MENVVKKLAELILNYVHYDIAMTSISTDTEEYKVEDFYKTEYTSNIAQSENAYVITFKDVNITEAINKTNNLKYDIRLTILLDEANALNVIQAEILDIDFIENESIDIYIKDFINGYINNLYDAILEIRSNFSEIGDSVDKSIKLNGEIQINLVLNRKNNIHPSIKSVFLNNNNVKYCIKTSNDFIDKVAKYAPELRSSIEDLLTKNEKIVTELMEYDNSIVTVDVKELEKDFEQLLSSTPETISELVKYMICNSIIRAGVTMFSNILALFDNTEDLIVEYIIYSQEIRN